MDTFAAFLGLASIAGVLISLIVIIVNAIRIKPKKIAILLLIAFFVMFIVAFILTNYNENSPAPDQASAPTEKPITTPTFTPIATNSTTEAPTHTVTPVSTSIPTPTFTPVATPTHTPTPTPTPSPTATATVKTYASSNVHQIGETVVFNEIEVKVNKVSFSQFTGGIDGLGKADKGFLNCVIDIDVKNTTTNTLQLVSWPNSAKYMFLLIHDGENKYTGRYYRYTDFFDAIDSIPAKGTLKNKKLSFIVPDSMKNDGLPIELVLQYNSVWKSGEVVWRLR